jgi:F-type H+-transporting ATPase subunit b
MLIDWFTVVAQVINFLVLVWLLKRFLYRPILNAIDIREKRIAAELADAQNKQAEALRERDEFQKKNTQFDKEYTARMNQVAQDAKAEHNRLLESARQEFNDLRNTLQLALNNEQLGLKDALSLRARDEVFAIARKTLTDLAATSLESRMVEVFIERLQALSDEEKTQLKTAFKTSQEPLQVHSAFALPAQMRESVLHTLKSVLDDSITIEFTTESKVVSGIEVNVNGQKISWSIDHYLASLAKSVNQVLQSNDKDQAQNESQDKEQQDSQKQGQP